MIIAKKKLLIVLALVVVIFAGISIFSACNSDKDNPKVTFMVQNDKGEWASFHEAEVVDGKVEMPKNPDKLYYNFSNWYYKQDLTGDAFANKDIKQSISVYAKFVPIEVGVVINGENLGTQNLIDVVNGTYDPGEGLEFSGWYTNANFTESTKWDGKSIVTTLYARSVARITFNNGYEDVFTTTVTPGTVFTNPASEGGIEATEIRKNYMSKYDIAYWGEDNKEFDFSQPITQNTNITVTWRSPFLAYQVNEATGNLRLTMYQNDKYIYDDTQTDAKANTVPVISIPGELTFDMDKDGIAETYKVEEVNLNGTLLSGSVIEKLIIGEGISIIQNINASTACTIKEISLPSTLKVIINCFNNLNKLQTVEIPQGVEVIIGSFWANCNASWNSLAGKVNLGEPYSFDIKVPSSVKNLSMIPANFIFEATKSTAEIGEFYRDGNYVYKIDNAQGHEGKLLLIADYSKEGGTLIVPEGVEGIQVGTYMNRSYNYIVLPESFNYIGYNANANDYAAYTYNSSTYSGCNNFLWDEQFASSPRGNIAIGGYAVYNKIDDLINLVFNGEALVGDCAGFAFMGDPTGNGSMIESQYEPYTSTSYKDVVVYIGKTDTPQVQVVLKNEFTGESYSAKIEKNKNDKLTLDELLKAIDTANSTSLYKAYSTDKVLKISSVTSFGAEYDFDKNLTTNVYLTIVSDYVIDGGYIAEDNGDGTAKITGFANNGYKTSNGLYIVGIPNEVTINGAKLKVTEIADGAFDATKNPNCINIGYVSIPSSVKVIGEKAFYMCEGLVGAKIATGGLEVVGASAFEGTSLTEIALPLANLKEVGAYAFKTETLKEFIPAKGEEDRNMLTKSDLKVGDFFIRQDIVGIDGFSPVYGGYGLYQYAGKTTSEDGVTTWNVKFVASAGAVNANKDIVMISLGDITDSKNIINYEVMEGSFYYINDKTKYSTTIIFNSVSKIHQNAFTDCGTDIYIQYSDYMGEFSGKTLAEFISANQSVFEDGWYQGYTEEGMGKIRLSKV